MTYQKLKEMIIQKDNGVMTEKQFNRFILRYFLTMFTFTLVLLLVVSSLLHSTIAIFVILGLMVIMFMEVLKYCAEEEKALRIISKLSHFLWIVNIGLLVGAYLLLKAFYFV